MSAERIVFDAATHTYTLDGVLVPGVSSILKPVSGIDNIPKRYLDAAAAFGTAVHRGCELLDHDDLDWDTVDESLVPYLKGWQAFSQAFNVEWEMIEGIVYSASHGYAGTLDRYGNVGGRKAVVDIKSGSSLYPSYGPQLAAYKNAIPNVPPTTDRLVVHLRKDGGYDVVLYKDKTDWPLFLSLLTVRNWCAAHKVTPNL